jgi:hypothetical protein
MGKKSGSWPTLVATNIIFGAGILFIVGASLFILDELHFLRAGYVLFNIGSSLFMVALLIKLLVRIYLALQK